MSFDERNFNYNTKIIITTHILLFVKYFIKLYFPQIYVENVASILGTLNRRRKQRQARTCFKPNVCIPIVGFL